MNRFKLKALFLVMLFAVVCALSAQAQESSAKKPLTFEDYGRWQSISATTISEDGQWITYAYAARDKDGTLFLKNLETDKSYELPRGASPTFSDDGKWAAYLISPPNKEGEQSGGGNTGGQRGGAAAAAAGRKAELLNLASGEKYTIENGSSVSFSKGSKYLAVKKRNPKPKKDAKGSDLLLWNLEQGFNDLIGNVKQHSFNKPGTVLAYLIDVPDKDGNGIYMVNLANGARRPLDTDEAIFDKMTWNEEGQILAALKGNKDDKLTERDNQLLAFTKLTAAKPEKTSYNPKDDDDFPEGMVISEKGNLSFSLDLTKVFFAIKEQQDEPKETKSDDVVANVDIWHWNDEKIQPVQIVQASRDRNFTYRAVLHRESKRFVRLTDEEMRSISITRDGKWGIGSHNKPYIHDWKPSKADYYRVNIASGERKLMFKAHERTMGLSPDSKHFLYWLDGNIWDYHLPTSESINLTKDAPVDFANKDYDHPGTVPPFGVTGWTKDGNAVILTHKYDLFLQPLDGSEAVNLTKGEGTKNEIILRYVRLDSEEKFIDLSQPLMLSAMGKWTKKAGYYQLNNATMTKLIYEDKKFGRLAKAKRADKILYTIQTFSDFPNYYVSDMKFTFPKKHTDANPWQKEYVWGHRILFDFKNSQGVRLQGTLAIPDTYEEGNKLPMHVNYYEKNSQNLHSYTAPRAAGSPNFAGMVSNGYLVMQPDIHLNTGRTHSDMLDCVEAAVTKVIELGYADPKAVSLHGHSFSGQGSAFISTRSKMFAAIVYGAGATDLVADFNQLWKSSGTSQHRYDIYGQGRFGTNPYDDPELFKSESAVYNVETMDTPLMFMQGSEDGSVEYYQAVEFYNALRFNGKNAIMLEYPGAGHGLRKLVNQKDFQKRTRQFLDHYLKGKPAPEWMTKGQPYIKGKTRR